MTYHDFNKGILNWVSLTSVNKTTKSFENILSWKLVIRKILAKAPEIKLKII